MVLTSELTDHYTRPWFEYVSPQLQDLVRTGLTLYQRFEAMGDGLADYSFIIFPVSKAYEGFLKQYLLDLNLIDQETYQSRRFRIGRAINPDLRHQHRDKDWLFDDLTQLCGEAVARQLWQTWLESRNRIFHYFPGDLQMLSLPTVKNQLDSILTTIDEATDCQPELLRRKSSEGAS